MADNYKQFRTRYEDMSDGELLELAEQSDDLVPDAQAALKDELEARGLAAEADGPEPPAGNAPIARAAGELSFESALLADPRRMQRMRPQPAEEGLALLHSTESTEEAAEIQRHLTDQGIASQLQVMILVSQDDADKAYKLLEALPGFGPETEEDEEEEDR